MQWFIDPIKNQYADFTGRTTRKAFWMFVLFYLLLNVAISIVTGVVGLEEVGLLFSLAVLLPAVAITARRLHDIGKSGWWQLVGFVPIIGWIIVIVWNAMPGQDGANTYGPDPREAAAAGVVPMATAEATPVATSAAPPVAPQDAENTGEEKTV